MSLDVYLTESFPDLTECLIAADRLHELGMLEAEAWLRRRENYEQWKDSPLYDANITHNIGAMAEAAGIYKACWRPEEIGITKAFQLIPLLEEGIRKMRADRTHFETFNAPNGWRTYLNFLSFVESYLDACKKYPHATVSVSR